jgi:AraC-like DNA-binding protein/mannose-6-phosphate isomerase-like protein (cupin superfamily)|tara:strand:+ start:3808 stop:4677 length:870 start_codon:yes stop_codon:yes gene_type:complete
MEHKKTGKLRRQTAARIEVPAGQVRVLESHHAAGFEMKLGTWPFHKICWVAVGRGQLEFSGHSTEIQRNDFLLLPANCQHRFIDDPHESLTLVMVCVNHELTAAGSALRPMWTEALGHGSLGQAHCGRSAFHHNEFVEDFRRGLREQLNRESGWELSLTAVAQDILIRMARGHCVRREAFESSSVAAVRGSIDYLEQHFYGAQRIEDMAERCDLSPRRFTALFKAQTGLTFSHYLNQLRIEYAQRRLQQSGHILYACYESGFNDPAYFYRVFKKHTGQTPGQYLSDVDG